MRLRDYDKTALIEGNTHIKYAELQEKVASFAAVLNIEEGDHCLLFSENRIGWIIALFAVWQKGGVAVPVDAESKAEEVAYFLKDSESKAVIVSPGCKDVLETAMKLLRIKLPVIPVSQLDHVSTPAASLPDPDPETTALILYTSGTTGDPKGVMLSYNNLFSNLKSIEARQIVTPKDTVLSLLPFHHAYPLMTTVLLPLYMGATVVLQKSLAGQEILATMKRHRVTILVGVPRLYELFHTNVMGKLMGNLLTALLFKASRRIGSKKFAALLFGTLHRRFGGYLRYFISGGAKLDPQIQQDFSDLGFTFLEGYGLSETSPIVSFNIPGAIQIGSVGHPIPGTRVKIEEGELLISGENLMQGYYNKPDKTAEVIKDGWFYTGDLGYLNGNGFLYVTGRKKDQIVLPNGKNINPEEIEKELQEISPFVGEVAVTHKNKGLLAIIRPDIEALHAMELYNLHESIKWKVIDPYNRGVVTYKKILDFKIIDTELPKTRLGKLKRFKLHELLDEHEERPDEEIPSDRTYKALAAFLSTLTNEKIYPSRHLEIDLGIDSLGMVELQSFIQSSYSVSIDEKKLAQLETVEDLYRFLKEQKKEQENASINWREILSEPRVFHLFEGSLLLRLFRTLLSPIIRRYFSLRVSGLEHLPKTPCILAANHQSMLDAFILASALPGDFVAKGYVLGNVDYFRSLFARNLGRQAHVVTVDYNKELKETLQKSAYLLRQGKNLLIFPEGARTRNGNLQEFKKFFAILAETLDIPVVPVTINGTFDALPIGRRFPLPKEVSVTISWPISPNDNDTEELTETVRLQIQKTIKKQA